MYLLDLGEVAMVALVRNLKKWMPDHQPVLTAVRVARLALEERGLRLRSLLMLVIIEQAAGPDGVIEGLS